MSTPVLSLSGVTKFFGKLRAVDDLSLEIREGDVFTLLGPSGCGKTTTLRMMAGLEKPDAGEIFLRGRCVVSAERGIFVPPEKRNMGMVFQSYAIWPHMTVFENVAYPLRLRNVDKSTIKSKVSKVLDVVGLAGLEDRLAPHLSGGQQQRVALARALVYEPEILLLDEPLSNLDAKLREQMRVELRLLQTKLGLTLVYVTHDQLEALSLSDTVAVFNDGRVEQSGVPQQLYERPASAFVRDFLGKTILFAVAITAVHGQKVQIELEGQRHAILKYFATDKYQFAPGQRAFLAFRPEDLVISKGPSATQNGELEGTVETVLFLGDRLECRIRVGKQIVITYPPRTLSLVSGETVYLDVPCGAASVWPATTA